MPSRSPSRTSSSWRRRTSSIRRPTSSRDPSAGRAESRLGRLRVRLRLPLRLLQPPTDVVVVGGLLLRDLEYAEGVPEPGGGLVPLPARDRDAAERQVRPTP